MNSNISNACSIYIVSHKRFNPPCINGYIPIAVGQLALDSNCSYCSDNTGENISYKNPFYCELTALYWIWKNDKSSDLIGLCHYRRYFTKSYVRCSSDSYLSSGQASKLLLSHDLILPKPYYWPTLTVGEKYYLGGMGNKRDLLTTREVIAELTPDYLSAFDSLLDSHSASYCNMFVMPRHLFDSYCLWLFTVLEEVENRIDISDYTVQEARVFGYISELLLNVWVTRNSLDAALLPIVNTKYGIIGNTKDRLRTFRSKMKVR